MGWAGRWRPASCAALLALCSCQGPFFLEHDPEAALLVAVGGERALRASWFAPDSSPAWLEGVSPGEKLRVWSFAASDFALPTGAAPSAAELSGVEPRLSSTEVGSSPRCPCADPGPSSPARVFGAQRCPVPLFAESRSYRLDPGALEPIDSLPPEFSSSLRLDWPGQCDGDRPPPALRVAEICPLTEEALRPSLIAGDSQGVVLGANPAGIVLVDPRGVVHERLFKIGEKWTAVAPLDVVSGKSTFVLVMRSGDERGLLIVRWDPAAPPEEALELEAHPGIIQGNLGNESLFVPSPGVLEILASEGGGEASPGLIVRCENIHSGLDCRPVDLGLCRRTNEAIAAGLRLPDGSSLALSSLGTLLARQAGSLRWTCGPSGQPPQTVLEGKALSALATEHIAWSGRQLAACLRAYDGSRSKVLVASAELQGLSFDSSGDPSPSRLSWQVLHEGPGFCLGAIHDTSGRLIVLYGGDQASRDKTTAVEVDGATGSLIGVHPFPGTSEAGALPAIGRPIEKVERVGDATLLLGADGAIVRSSSAATSVLYHRQLFEPDPLRAVGRWVDRLAAISRGGTLVTVDASEGALRCAELSKQERALAGFDPADLPVALALSSPSKALVSVESAGGSHELREVDLERQEVSSSVITEELYIDLAHLSEDSFVLIDDKGGLASYRRGQVERLSIEGPDGVARWSAVSAAGGLGFAVGQGLLAQVSLGPSEDPGKLRVQADWLERAGQGWSERQGADPPELNAVEAWSPWRASIAGVELRQVQGVLRVDQLSFFLELAADELGPAITERFQAGSWAEALVAFGPEGSFALGRSGEQGTLRTGEESLETLPYGRPARARSAGLWTLVGGANGRLYAIRSQE